MSGIKNLRLLKTAQTTFVGFHRDAYRTLKDQFEKVLRLAKRASKHHRMINVHCCISSTNLSSTWTYKDDLTVIDYNNVWKRAKDCIIKSWGGDVVEGVLSTCIQFSIQTAETSVLQTIPEISSIEILMPNLLYGDFDFTRFESLTADSGKRKIYLPVEKPAGIVFAKMVRKKNYSNGK